MKYNILNCVHFILEVGNVKQKRVVKNYEFDYNLQNERVTVVDGKKQYVKAGSICFRRPGQTVESYGNYNCFMLTVDFSCKTPVNNYNRNSFGIIEEIFSHPLLDELPDVINVHHTNEMEYLFSLLERQADTSSLLAHTIFEEILLLINVDLKHNFLNRNVTEKNPAETILKYMHTHFKEKITLKKLSDLVHLNKNYLVRLFRQQYGTTPIDYLNSYRLKNAQILLTDTDLSVNQIALECGFQSSSFFIVQFKKLFSLTPNEYRQNTNSKI